MMAMKMAGGCGMQIGIMLIALGLGYIVWYLSNREEKDLRIVGKTIGTIIVGLSMYFIVSALAMYVGLLRGGCPIGR